MRRGDLVTVSLRSDDGKPRPALVIQSDAVSEAASRTVLPLTSKLVDAPLIRIAVAPTPGNGLRAPSQVMIDKAVIVPAGKLGPVFGTVDDGAMLAVNWSLALFLGVAG